MQIGARAEPRKERMKLSEPASQIKARRWISAGVVSSTPPQQSSQK
jgi:hypothetical protein